MQLLELRNISFEANLVEVLKHDIEFGQHPLDDARYEFVRQRHVVAQLVPEDLVGLVECKVVACEAEFRIVVYWILGIEETLEGEKSNVAASDQGHGFGGSDGYFPPGSETLAEEVIGEVVHERYGPEDGIRHFSVGCLIN